MRTDLFRIPLEVNGVPLFGFGILLLIWFIGCVCILGWVIRKYGLGKEAIEYIPSMLFLGAGIFFIPKFIDNGIPIRGYGVMVLTGAACGIALACYRARQMGLNPEVIISVSFWMVIAGILSARIFYVAQYWNAQFASDTVTETLKKVVDYTNGGLVVYGAIIGGALMFFGYAYRHKLPPLALADIIVPGVAIGMAFGRIGCFLHGCCYGGLCDTNLAVTFPPDSPPYLTQLAEGQIYGFTFWQTEDNRPAIAEVNPNSNASKLGMKRGEIILSINDTEVKNLEEAGRAIGRIDKNVDLNLTTNHGNYVLTTPARSLPVHPTQIYSSIHAFAMSLLLLTFYPYRKYDGQVLALFMLIYPIGRYFLELIRNDEKGQLGTSLTISQWISVIVLISAVLFWIILKIRKSPPALPKKLSATVA